MEAFINTNNPTAGQRNIGHRIRFLVNWLIYRNGSKRIKRLYRNKMVGDKVWTLVSYPKCGRTWLRYMICQAEALAYGIPLINTIHGVRYRHLSLPRVAFSHKILFDKQKPRLTLDVECQESRYKGMIFLVRKPERVMISFYHQARDRDLNFQGSISQFIRDPRFGIDSYVRYVEHGLIEARKTDHMILTYEQLLEDTYECLQGILEFVELPLTKNHVGDIVRSSSFREMKDAERNNKFRVGWLRPGSRNNKQSYKVRSGGRDSLSAYFLKEDLEYMRFRYETSEAFEQLGYLI